MLKDDTAAEVRAQGWRTLAALHAMIESHLERVLQAEHQLSVSEYSVLEVLSRQDDWHMRMQQLANAVVLSQSAVSRLVGRLEKAGLLCRFLCETDRRGIYTEVTDAGRELLARARPTHDAALREALDEADARPELAPLVTALAALPTHE
ncbi:MarR family winged helix-turn-helix transcriptional regulator [Streptoalloteichus hindustanus]|uniref:DNA-binding transcriptional regulator, MarR family n=1 Tax=Streptoalloteichus hindustanus TaxID=2017 RepID=A0A1M5JTG4_STRHI|nr:MarR family transcriptional regulator [Streptoalloteichus hindustanus]SHG43273.1 DNA-binding transcriptional regulator, MarR family [Streptoalloteichus hindustanus]